MAYEVATAKGKHWLRHSSGAVLANLRASLTDPRVVLSTANQLVPEATNTAGWMIRIARLQGRRAEAVELWLDRFANVARPAICLCYFSRREEAVAAIAKVGIGRFREAQKVTESRVVGDDYARLSPPLSREEFRRPIWECYHEWHFLSVYFDAKIDPRRPPSRKVVASVSETAKLLLRAASAALPADTSDFPKAKRTAVSLHLKFERSSTQVRAAKIRDGFTCSVCRINFTELYGPLGRGYAEAHHRVPLSKLRVGQSITADQLITVCANCHRMLHKMDGKLSDITVLQRRFSWRWPRRPTTPG